MLLFDRGNISLLIVENRIKELEDEKKELQKQLTAEQEAETIIKNIETELSDQIIEEYINKFEVLFK